MAGYDGLALSMYDKNAISFTDDGAHNFFSITVTDATTVTSGYIQPFYASITTSGSFTTGNTQINAFAVDLFLGGTITCEAEGMYIYIAKSGTPTLASANINGVNIYIDDLGGTSTTRISGIQIHWADDGTSDGAAFMYFRMEGSGAAAESVFEFGGTAALAPDYFITTNHAASSGNMWYGSYTPTAVTGIGLKCNINGAVYLIPLCASTSAA